jgi:tetratricopeptide (TPR) repeat protein
LDKAIETIDRAIQIYPEVANYYDSKGEFLYRKGDKAGAMKMWEKVISLDPVFPQKQNSQLYHYLFKKE